MALVIASGHLSDGEFIRAFTAYELPLTGFRHGDHLRFAWILLHDHGPAEALRLVRSGIQRFAQHHRVPGLYHETVTTAWVSLLATHAEATFESFIAKHEDRLNLELLHQFWTPSLLNSQEAKLRWLPPDRKSLPQ